MFKEISILLQSKNNNCNNNDNKEESGIFSYYFESILNISPSIYLQLSFHMIILFLLLMFGVIFSLLNMIFEDKYNEMNELQNSMGSNTSSKKKNNSSTNNNSINYRFKK